ncbi:MAG TPA: hypothetical protein VFL03_06080 [Candidatus Limnocylindrales bacterium]|nr:hypothetical protein [Candidatus Limnocylindrales bacterium]
MEKESTVLRSRRAVIGAALGGAAALAAANVAKPLAVTADTGDNLLLGTPNTADAETSVTSTIDTNAFRATIGSATGLRGESTDATPTVDFTVESHKTGVIGTAGDPSGMLPNTDEIGVFGYADTSPSSAGIAGHSPGGNGVYANGDWGVYATGNIAIAGDVGSTGVGVYGFTGNTDIPLPPAGVGVYARAASTAQTALQVVGKVKFSRSGRVAISAGSSSKLVTMSGVTETSYVIATLQTSSSGLYVRAVVTASGKFRIYLSKAAPKRVVVGYLVVN